MPAKTRTPVERLLETIGISALEQRIYEILLQGYSSVTEISERVGCSPRRAREVLAGLEDIGLVNRSATKSPRYLPADPEAVLASLLADREVQLRQAHITARQLIEQFRQRVERADGRDVVEVTPGGKGALLREADLMAAAEHEILAFSTLPFFQPEPSYSNWKLDILRRGVRGRVVYSSAALEVPGMVDLIETLGTAGEEARTYPELPMKLLIVDRKVARLPLDLAHQDLVHDWVLVHESSLLDSLVMLFELVWERATPFAPTRAAGEQGLEDGGPSSEDRRLLALLGAGLKDVAIARQLGVSPRTLERRLSVIMDELGARTRFQTALEAARRGWIGGDIATAEA